LEDLVASHIATKVSTMTKVLKYAALLFLIFHVPSVDSFAIHRALRDGRPAATKQFKEARSTMMTSTTRILAKNEDSDSDKMYVYGNDRGNVLLTIVMAFCIWQFSIPPSFRRAHICYTPACIEQRSLCSDCITLQEWSADVSAYYKNGGGVQWDFSIDPRTIEQNQQKWDEVFGKK
jgi:hypothetical protein